MNILIINPIMYTPFTGENSRFYDGTIPKVDSIKDTWIYGFALGFKENRHNVTIYAAEDYKPIQSEEYDINVIFGRTGLKKIFKPTAIPYLPDLKKFLKDNHDQIDFVISLETFMISSFIAARCLPYKLIIMQDLALHVRKFHQIPSKLWYHIVVPLFFRKVKMVAHSKGTYNFLSKYSSNVSKQTVEHGININVFEYNIRKKEQFIVVSQLVSRKNIESIIKKFAAFLEKYKTQHQLLIVGKGELFDSLLLLVNQLNLEKSVFLLGQKPHKELKTLLSESQAMLLDTLQDNNLISFPEAIACGTPIITNRIPTNSSFVEENGVGIVKDTWNEDDLYDIIIHNAKYVERCGFIRNEVSNVFLAKKMVDIFMKECVKSN